MLTPRRASVPDDSQNIRMEFTVRIVDLRSQARAFNAATFRLSTEEKLALLRANGHVLIAEVQGLPVYHFQSFVGIHTPFVINDGRVVTIGDHTMDAVEP